MWSTLKGDMTFWLEFLQSCFMGISYFPPESPYQLSDTCAFLNLTELIYSYSIRVVLQGRMIAAICKRVKVRN